MSYYPEQEQEYEFYADPTTAAPMLGTVDNKMATMTAAPMMATTAPMMTTAAPMMNNSAMSSDQSWKRHYRGKHGRRNTLLTVVVLLLLVCLVWYLYNHPEETSAATNQVKFQRFRFRR